MRKILNFLPAHIERVLKIFPDWTMPGRSFAEQFAEQVKGKIVGIEQEGRFLDYRIVETRIEMNPDDARAGQVVAICEEEFEMPEPETIEITLQTYGQKADALFLTKSVAEKYASAMEGQTIAIDGDTWHAITYKYASKNHYRILSTHLEDDNPGDPERGRVVAICQPIQQRQMEVK